ncbi:MAG: NAD(P)H-dependent oxidoreductase subunit E [Alkalispirochaeta sp.]
MAPTTHTELPEELASFIKDWRDRPGNLIMILHRVQQHYGYLPELVADEVCRRTSIAASQLYGVATFYNYFNLSPPGKHRVAVCMGTACYLKGAGALTEELRNHLNVEVNGVTQDKQFSLQEVRCVGCCGLAPVVMVDDEVHGKLGPEGVQALLDKCQEND